MTDPKQASPFMLLQGWPLTAQKIKNTQQPAKRLLRGFGLHTKKKYLAIHMWLSFEASVKPFIQQLTTS
jgi:hypothetical protein